MFLRTTVTKWKDSVGHNMIRGNTEFFLNTNMMTDITTLTATSSRMLFADTVRDNRMETGLLECNSTVAEIRTAGDTVLPSKFLDLNIFPKNKTSKTAVAFKIQAGDIVWAKANGAGDWTWIYYDTNKGEMVLALADLTMDEFEVLAWASYWETQDEVLFFAEVLNVADGKLYNQKTGATDYLTVTGAAGSYAFECPDTAPYIAADNDYIWFKSDETQRTPTEAELIGHDFERTIIKYSNEAPYSLDAIMILKSTLVVTQDFKDKASKDFSLYLYYFYEYNGNGFLKENRPASRWAPIPVAIADGNTVGHWLYDVTADITKDINDYVSSWADNLASGHDLIQATAAYQPKWTSEGVLFDGSNDALRSAFALDQPITVYIVVKVLTWGDLDYIFDGSSTINGCVRMNSTSPNIVAYAGTLSTENTNMPINEFCIIRAVFNGANSKLQVNETVAITGNFGVSDPEGLSIGARGGTTVGCAHIQVTEVIDRKVSDSAKDWSDIYFYLRRKYGIT